MDSQILDQLKKCSRDKAAFVKLKELYDELEQEVDQREKQLGLLESAIENDYDAIMITDLKLEKPGPRIVYVNDGFCKMTGYTKEEVVGKTPRILQGPKTDRSELDRLKKRLSNGQSFFGKTINYRKDESEFVNQWDIHPLTDSGGNITHWVSYQHDITERKRAENTLMDTQVEFDSLREESQRIVLDVNLDGDVVYSNKMFREMVGYSMDDLKEVMAWELFPKKYRNSLKKRFEGNTQSENFQNQYFKGIIKHKNDLPIQVEGRTKVLELKDQTLIRAEVNNISLQKRIMEEVRKINQSYSGILRKTSEFNYRVGLSKGEPVVEFVSEEFPELTGLSPEKIKGEGGLKDLVHGDDIKEVKNHYQKIFNGSECTCEYRIRSKNGGYTNVFDHGKPKRDSESGEVVFAGGTISSKQQKVS